MSSTFSPNNVKWPKSKDELCTMLTNAHDNGYHYGVEKGRAVEKEIADRTSKIQQQKQARAEAVRALSSLARSYEVIAESLSKAVMAETGSF